MSARSFLERVESKIDFLQDYATNRSYANTMFLAGAASAAFGAAAGTHDFRDVGMVLWASPAIVSGTCMIARAAARTAKRLTPEP